MPHHIGCFYMMCSRIIVSSAIHALMRSQTIVESQLILAVVLYHVIVAQQWDPWISFCTTVGSDNGISEDRHGWDRKVLFTHLEHQHLKIIH
jgi:hypothetical protein